MDINNVKMSSQLNGSEAVSKERKGRGSIRWKRKGSYQDLVRGSNQEHTVLREIVSVVVRRVG
jgi:hypothetical protein